MTHVYYCILFCIPTYYFVFISKKSKVLKKGSVNVLVIFNFFNLTRSDVHHFFQKNKSSLFFPLINA